MVSLRLILQPYRGGNLQGFDGIVTRPLEYVELIMAFRTDYEMRIIKIKLPII